MKKTCVFDTRKKKSKQLNAKHALDYDILENYN